MRTLLAIVSGIVLLTVGYLLGSPGVLAPPALFAQANPAADPAKKGAKKAAAPTVAMPNISDETRTKIKAAADALTAAAEALKQDGLYTPATKGTNTFAILTGGGDATKDLDSGRGVDPDTFAALYSGLVNDELADKLGKDPEGRLTFNNKVIRMYPVSKLKNLYAIRAAITGEEVLAAEPDPAAAKKAAKKKAEAPATE